MSAGLKKELGLGDPRPAGSTEQADKFRSAFQAAMAQVNECLQYTAAHAEKNKHDPQASKRDKSCQAYQVAMSRIDPTNPAAAQSAIDQVLAGVSSLKSSIQQMKSAVEKAFKAWTERQGDLDSLMDKIREMVEWGHEKGSALQKIVEAILAKANARAYEEAHKALDQFLPKAMPLYEEYLKQKAAQEEYEPAFAALEPRLAQAKTCTYKLLAPALGEFAAASAEMASSAKAKDFVTAYGQLQQLDAKLCEFENQRADLDAKKQQYEAARAALEPQLAEVSTCEFKSLVELDQQIADLITRTDTAVNEEAYGEALAQVGELTSKVAEKLARVSELNQLRQQYEDTLSTLLPRLNAINSSDASTTVSAVQQALVQKEADMQAAADAEDYTTALSLQAEVEAKLSEYEAILAMRAEYESGLAALQPRLDEASISRENQDYLASIQADMASKQTEMEGAAQAEDFENALALLDQLAAYVDQYFEAIELKKQEYEKAAKGASSKADECLTTANEFAALKTRRDDVDNKFEAMRAAAAAEDWQTAKDLADELDKTAAAYLRAAAAEQKKYDEKAAQIEAKLDDANYFTEDDVARKAIDELSQDDLKHLPTKTRNRLLEELQDGNFSDEDKAAAKKLYSVRHLDPEFEKHDRQHRREMLDKLKNDPQFKEARTNWETMSEDKKIETLQKVADIQAEAYGIPKTTIGTFDPPRPPRVDPSDGNSYITNGEYGHDNGKLMLNTHPQSAFNNFDDILETTVHENGHRYQSTLIDKFEAGEIKPGDPLYEQARTFKLNDTQRGYYTFDKPEYFTQPQETHSRITGEALKNAQIGQS